jgi:excisionase family DNA binding protein
MYLTVQRAARSLGVSPQTIRRWTSTGFLPCTRTAGGHRRIRQEDVQELAQLIGDSNHLAARQARERELEVLVETSIALAGELELGELLKEVARRLTALMGCNFCGISTFDQAADAVAMLADFDDRGRRLPTMQPYALSRFPCTRMVLDEQRPAVVNVSDRRADASEVAELLAGGDKSLLMVPLVFRGRSIGLLELIDRDRERRYSRQELRLCSAIAGQAAVALHNAQVFSAIRDGDDRSAALQSSLVALRERLPELLDARSTADVLRAAAEAACALPGALSCVATAGGSTAGATSPAVADGSAGDPGGGAAARLFVASGPQGSDVSLATSVSAQVRQTDTAYLDLVAFLAAGGLRRAGAAD